MSDPVHIVISAANAARRSRLAELVRRSLENASATCSASMALEEMKGASPDIWLADLESGASADRMLETLGDLHGVFGTVALIDDPEPQWVRSALIAGVNAILTRDPDREELRLAVQAADAGFVLLHPSSVEHLTAIGLLGTETESDDVEHLTPREKEVLRLIGEGLGNKEIAARLAISEHTAKFHISSILGKLNVSSRAEAVSQGIRRGLIPI